MTHRLLAVLVLFLMGGCTSDAAAPGASSAGGSATDEDTTALPPSRAGDATPANDYESALSALLAQVVTEKGRVRYDVLRGRRNEAFRRVLKAVEEYDPAQLQSPDEKLAFWINAYNVQMLANILAAWPVRDVSAHDRAFFNEPLRVARTALSLDQIENVILRRQDGPARAEALQAEQLDPRLHAAINCAARSCPRLRQAAYAASTVGTQLRQAMRDFTGSPEHFRRDGNGFVLNAILKWYGADFDYAGRAAGTYLLSFMPEDRPDYDALRRLLKGRTAEELRQRENVSFQYDWTLNATPASLPAPTAQEGKR